MRFPAKTREILRESQGKPVEIDWPEGAEPRPHHLYTVQASSRAGETRIRVLFVDEFEAGRWRAMVRVDDDPVRLLGKSGGSTERVAGAIATRVAPPPDDALRFAPEFEPERLSEADESDVVRESRARRNAGLEAKKARVDDALADLEEDVDPAKVRFLRNMARGLEGKVRREEAVDRGAA